MTAQTPQPHPLAPHIHRQIRLGGLVGMLGVIVFVASTFFVDNTMPATGLNLVSGPEARALPEAVLRVGDFGLHVVAPLCFLYLFQGMREWMRSLQHPFADWFYTLGLLSCASWLAVGGIRFFLYPSTIYEDRLPFILLSSALFDMAYFLQALYHLAISRFMMRQAHPKKRDYWGGQSRFIGGTVLLILLLGPYESLNIFVIYAYGAPAVALFGEAALLLRFTDRLAQRETTPSHPTPPTL